MVFGTASASSRFCRTARFVETWATASGFLATAHISGDTPRMSGLKMSGDGRVLRGSLAALLCLLAKPASADTLAEGIVSDQLVMDDEFVVGVSQPTAVAFVPDGRMLITERTGAVVLRTQDGTLTTAATLDVDSVHGERGLLNVLPHPEFEDNHLLYFYYSASETNGGSSADRHRVVTLELGDDNLLDLSTEQILLRDLQGPANHNGGGLAIHGDYLYVGTGDTGRNSNAAPGEGLSNFFGTCLTNAQGKVLRLHLDGSIPEDNPLIGQTVTACGDSAGVEPTTTSDSPREEIFAWGFRNAFRLWADPQTGNVWVGNVGEITYEMIQLVPPTGGVHFGWPYREGNEGLPADTCQTTTPNTGNCVDAVYVCEQSSGGANVPPDNPDVPNDCDSITGGLILDDCAWPEEFAGKYVFGDYTSGNVWTLPLNETRDGVIGEREPLVDTGNAGPVQFFEYDGALYIVAHAGSGHITRVAPATTNCEPAPTSDAGAPMSDAGAPMSDGGLTPAVDASTPDGTETETDVSPGDTDVSETDADTGSSTDTATPTTDTTADTDTNEPSDGAEESDVSSDTEARDAGTSSSGGTDDDCDCSVVGKSAPSGSAVFWGLAACVGLLRRRSVARRE